MAVEAVQGWSIGGAASLLSNHGPGGGRPQGAMLQVGVQGCSRLLAGQVIPRASLHQAPHAGVEARR